MKMWWRIGTKFRGYVLRDEWTGGHPDASSLLLRCKVFLFSRIHLSRLLGLPFWLCRPGLSKLLSRMGKKKKGSKKGSKKKGKKGSG